MENQNEEFKAREQAQSADETNLSPQQSVDSESSSKERYETPSSTTEKAGMDEVKDFCSMIEKSLWSGESGEMATQPTEQSKEVQEMLRFLNEHKNMMNRLFNQEDRKRIGKILNDAKEISINTSQGIKAIIDDANQLWQHSIKNKFMAILSEMNKQDVLNCDEKTKE